jgi:myosin heavy subunit
LFFFVYFLGTDITWLEKMNQAHEKHAHYEKPRTSKDMFVIKHYAGDVSYWVDGFLEKNKDKLQE